MEHLIADPGDVVIPPLEDGRDDEFALLVWATEDDYVVLSPDDNTDNDDVAIHKDQIDDLIIALKTVKETMSK